MIYLHAGDWDGSLYLWGESEDKTPTKDGQMHPFAATPKEISAATKSAVPRFKSRPSYMTVWLPTTDTGPISSLDGIPESRDGIRMAPWAVRAIHLSTKEAIDILCAVLEGNTINNAQAGGDLRYWAKVLQMAALQVKKKKYLPNIVFNEGKYTALWDPVFLGEDEERLEEMARAMPAAARAITPSSTNNPQGQPVHILRRAVTSMVDEIVRESMDGQSNGTRRKFSSMHALWLYNLRIPGPIKSTSIDTGFISNVQEWRRPVDIHADYPFRLCIRLEEPESEELDEWHIRYLVQSKEDPSLIVTAEKVLKGHATQTLGADAAKFLLSSLALACDASPSIAASIKNGHINGYTTDAGGAYKFLTEEADDLRLGANNMMLPAWWKWQGAKPKLAGRMEASKFTTPSGMLSLESMVSFDWEAALGDEKMSLQELEELAEAKMPLVRVRGKWMAVNASDILSAVAFMKKRPKRMTLRDAIRAALGMGNMPKEVDFDGVSAKGGITGVLNKLDGSVGFEELDQPERFVGELRPYQIRGYSWLASLGQWGLGGCLADDMGLGKTIQVLALIQRDWPDSKRPTLIVCPTSVINNWHREAARFTPELPVMIHHGPDRIRNGSLNETANNHAIVITSYGLIQRDLEMFRNTGWRGIVLDEAQNIKNPETKQSAASRLLEADYRFALTGTPVENHLGDLWSIMEFLNPGFLGSRKRFTENFLTPIQTRQDSIAAERLRRATGPFILRRLKTDKNVISDLPEKMESKVYCTLTREQASLYASVLKDAEEVVRSAEGIRRKGIILSMLSKLKQICNHPAHFLADNSSISNRSGKLSRLTEMLEEVVQSGDKALVFSQFAKMGEMLQKHLQKTLGTEALFLHGRVPRDKRDEMIERFQSRDGPPIFVLSLKAGGIGLNLTSANHVFHFDRWWNPAVEDQATDRAFRIGQKRNVLVHKMICAGTLEEKIDDLIENKKRVAQEVVGTGEGWLTEMSNEDLRKVLTLSKEAAGA